MLRKFGIIAVLSLIVTALAVVPALAVAPSSVDESGGLHVCQGSALDLQVHKTIDPTTGFVTSAYLTSTGEVCGAGTGGNATLSSTAIVTTGCVTPSESNTPKGLQRQSQTVVGTAELTITRPGRGTFDVATNPVTANRTCPSANMTPVITSVTFTDITLTITSGSGQIVATFPDQDP